MQKTLTFGDVPKVWVSESNISLVEELVKRYHYLGDKPFRRGFSYVLEYDGFIRGGLVWHSVSAPETVVGAFGLDRNDQKGFYELGRLVVSPIINHKNITGFFLSHSIRLLKKRNNVRALISYADSSKHVGTVYQACNFKYYGLTDKKGDFWVNGKIQERGRTKGVNGEWRPRIQKHRYMVVVDKSLKILWEEEQYPKCVGGVSRNTTSNHDEVGGAIPTPAHHLIIKHSK